jgi:hypothetical protein
VPRAAGTTGLHSFRQVIETVSRQLVEKVHVQRYRARSVGGLYACIQAKLAAQESAPKPPQIL